MKKHMQHIFYLLPLLLLWQQSDEQITATTEQVYYSVNAKTDVGVQESDMIHLDYDKLLNINGISPGGVIGTVNSGGEIKLEVFLYDTSKTDGIGSLIYGIRTNATISNNYGGNGWDTGMWCQSSWVPGWWWYNCKKSTDIKGILGSLSVLVHGGDLHGGGLRMVIDLNGKPLIFKITVRNATLTSLKIPGVGILNPNQLFDLPIILKKYHNPQSYPNYVIVAAHRGYWKDHAENSLAAFQAAIDQKVDMVEVDLKKTADGHLVLAHDFQLGRLTNIPSHLQQAQYQDTEHQDYILSKMNLCDIRPDLSICSSSSNQPVMLLRYPDETNTGTGTATEKLPTFEEFLDLCKDKIMVSLDKIDKDSAMMRKAYEIVRNKGMLHQTIFQGAGNKDASYYVNAYGIDAVPKILFTPAFFDDALGNNATPMDFKNRIESYITAGFKVPNCNLNYRTEHDLFLQKVFDNNTRNLIEYLYSQNIRSAMFPQWAETQRGNYNPNPRIYNDIRPDIDRRSDWDWMLSKGADMLITDRLEVLVKLLESKGLRQ